MTATDNRQPIVTIMPKKPIRMTSVDKLVDIACDGLHGCRWYRDATYQIDYVSFLEGWDRNDFAGVLATSSPRCSVLRNIRISLSVMKFGDLSVIPMKGIRTSVRKFLDGHGINGPKTSAFCANLSGDYGPVTLDVWMAYALGIDQTDFNTVANRAKATDRIVTVGQVLGLAPAEAQAAVWTGYRTRVGRNHSPFSVASEYFKARRNQWEIEGISNSNT